ncbi:hypothetical protein H0H81_012480 [Sphagnurus paluster]|uniref:Uncharacterized protein n=1 Tax=Sphagnurus paluster TaxID=117069 RepID=A0A9P7GPC1_9AGAR|nr:hypothetical protein H0H81_012480 [Sphagnurus paluster]
MRPSFQSILPLFLFYIRHAAAATNRTIDDTFGDSVTGDGVVYFPESAWIKNCQNCPLANIAFRGTSTTLSFKPNLGTATMELSFSGTALYVYFILSNSARFAALRLNYTLDGRSAGSFTHVPAGTSEPQFRALVFLIKGLPNTNHKFIASSFDNVDPYLTFDYAAYTCVSFKCIIAISLTPSYISRVETDDPLPTTPISSFTDIGSSTALETQTPTPSSDPSSDPSSKSKVEASAIAGGVAGGIAVLTALILLSILLWRRRKRSQRSGYIIHEDSGPGLRDRTPSIVPFPLDAVLLREVPSSDYTEPHSDSFPLSTTYLRSPASSSSEKQGFESLSSEANRTTINSSSLSPNPMPPPRNHGHISSASGSPLLPEFNFTVESGREAVREQRQQEIDRRLHDVKNEMNQLDTQKYLRELSSDLSPREIAEMRQQMREMREQIEYFQAQQQSEWAQGLSDEAPPGYSAQNPSL